MTVNLVWSTDNIDRMIAWMARVSNPNALRTDPPDKLIKYLIDHKHWSPFEMASICLDIETTRDIGRQLLRHRSFHFQEFSQRYAAVKQDKPRLQDHKNRQNSIPTDDSLIGDAWKYWQEHTWDEANKAYNACLDMGIAKEVARKLLPEGLTSTHLYMSGTVRDWFHYFQVRLGPETQLEHRQLAKEMYDVCKEVAPQIFSRIVPDA